MGIVASSFTNTMRKAFRHFSEKMGCKQHEIQVMIRAKDETAKPQYLLMTNFRVIREVTFKEILDVKVDLTGKELIATPFLTDTLESMSKRYDIPLMETGVIIYNTEAEPGEPILTLYNKNKIVKQLDLEEDIIG